MNHNRERIISIDIALDFEEFSESERDKLRDALEGADREVFIGHFARKGLAETGTAIWITVVVAAAAAKTIGLTKFCELFFEQLYDEVLRDRLKEKLSRFRAKGKAVSIVAEQRQNHLAIDLSDGSTLESAVKQLRGALAVLGARENLPFDPDAAQMLDYSHGTVHILVQHGIFDFDPQHETFEPHVEH